MTRSARFAARLPEILSEQIAYRELLRQMTRRDLLLRYKQTVMGFGWAIFMPLVNTAVFSVIFTRVAPIDVGCPTRCSPSAACWSGTSSRPSLRFSVTSLTSNPNLVTKVYFPREIFPFSAVLVCLVDFCGRRRLVLVGLMIYYGVAIGLAVLAAAGRARCASRVHGGDGAVAGDGNLFYRDVKYLFEIVHHGLDVRDVGALSRVGGRRPARRPPRAQPDDADHRRVSRRAPARRMPARRPSARRPLRRWSFC